MVRLIRLTAIRNVHAETQAEDSPLAIWVNPEQIVAIEATGRVGYKLITVHSDSTLGPLTIWEDGDRVNKLIQQSQNYWTKYEANVP